MLLLLTRPSSLSSEQCSKFMSFSQDPQGDGRQMAEKLTCTVKNESDTRWSAREAVRVIATHFSELI